MLKEAYWSFSVILVYCSALATLSFSVRRQISMIRSISFL
ncbi:hypothetical protein I3842_13G079100 [Carya illinoinensis]|uniref:Uncharacterized protein n=1 Tax=Carya illinoinensis TaxID=32201 RepID=A0A922DDK5_CARIL|nr:hypothetical protein I3842_13G079100 [Carya illinoinensis]